jgi:hypothetical protein
MKLQDRISPKERIYKRNLANCAVSLTALLTRQWLTPLDYEEGGKKGRVLTGYFESGPLSRHIGEIFWSKPGLIGEKDSK